jgi:eukaryotic translation initiation factor 2C
LQIIYNLEEMVYERLLHRAEVNLPKTGTRKLPGKIIYYRDGVSSSHYSKVQKLELAAIRRAYDKAKTTLKLDDMKLELTAVIVTKRHHTRFYPLNQAQGDMWGNWNTFPGTSVDKLVTSPYYQDFFLQSHIGIKGTAKPTHYFVLVKEDKTMTLRGLRDLVSIRPRERLLYLLI